MDLNDAAARAALAEWLRQPLAARTVGIDRVQRLSGGAIQQNWLVEATVAGGPRGGALRLVVRSDAAATISASHSRTTEFAVLRAAHAAGVTVPEPIGACAAGGPLGDAFFVTLAVPGVGLGPRIVRDTSLGGDREALARRIGAEFARIHSIVPPRDDLAALGPAHTDPARREIATLRAWLDEMGAQRPVLEWAARWAELHAPRPRRITLVHRDLRTGNYMVDAQGLTAILDWEFAGWGDPMSDLGWFCARCWRFGRPDLEAGGIASRAALYAGYAAAAGVEPDDAAVRYWEVVAHLRWAVIALQQAWRHVSGRERSLELGLIAPLVPELEAELLAATAPPRWEARSA